MRGDSIRDLYAKTLAVAGLGLLAAAGAIVDYWPAAGPLPAVTTVASLRPQLPVLAKLATNVSIEIPAPSVAAVARAHYRAPRTFSESLKPVTFAAAPLEAAPAVEAAPVPEFAIAAPDPDAAARLASSADVTLTIDLVAVPAEGAAPAPAEDRPFLSGALQRTKDTLKDARSFLGNKLGNIAGAFRRVSPFWDGIAITQFR